MHGMTSPLGEILDPPPPSQPPSLAHNPSDASVLKHILGSPWEFWSCAVSSVLMRARLGPEPAQEAGRSFQSFPTLLVSWPATFC